METKQFIDKVQAGLAVKEIKVNKKDTATMIKEVFEQIALALESGETVKVQGFGNFEPRTRKAGERRNPSTGETFEAPESVVPALKTSKTLKDRVKEAHA